MCNVGCVLGWFFGSKHPVINGAGKNEGSSVPPLPLLLWTPHISYRFVIFFSTYLQSKENHSQFYLSYQGTSTNDIWSASHLNLFSTYRIFKIKIKWWKHHRYIYKFLESLYFNKINLCTIGKKSTAPGKSFKILNTSLSAPDWFENF